MPLTRTTTQPVTRIDDVLALVPEDPVGLARLFRSTGSEDIADDIKHLLADVRSPGLTRHPGNWLR